MGTDHPHIRDQIVGQHVNKMPHALASESRQRVMPGASQHHEIGAERQRAQDVETTLHPGIKDQRHIGSNRIANGANAGNGRRGGFELAGRVVGHPDPVDAIVDKSCCIFRFLNPLDHQRSVPFATDLFQVVPVGIAANGVARMGDRGHVCIGFVIVLGQFQAGCSRAQSAQGPGRMQQHRNQHAQSDFRGNCQVCAALTFAPGICGHIHRHDQRLKPGRLGPSNHVAPDLGVCRGVKLEPTHVTGNRSNIFGDARGHGAQTIRQARRLCFCRQQSLSVWPDQAGHAQGGNAEGAGKFEPEHPRRQVGFAFPVQDRGHEADRVQSHAIDGHAKFAVTRGAVEIGEHEVGHPAFCGASKIGKGRVGDVQIHVALAKAFCGGCKRWVEIPAEWSGTFCELLFILSHLRVIHAAMSNFDEFDAFEDAAAPGLAARAMAARAAPYLDDLNPAQRDAVETLNGPVLMLAGAGTGKTKALTTRIAHLLTTATARPNEILAVTFTNKAAREMKLRIGRLLGEAVEGMPWLGTFHAIGVKLLRRHAELVGLKSNFTILDTDDQLRLLKQLVQAENIDDKRWPARQLAHIIDGWKNRAWGPDQVPAAEASAYDGKGVGIYRAYQERLKTLNACDFGDLLLHVVWIFQNHEDVLTKYQRWFRYILVDEYQDTNVAQYLWLRLLAGGHQNICCVGDDDQSIYGWRGAEVGNILRFETDFPGAKVIRLEQNYRSTPHILAAAAGVIDVNKGRLGKTLWTDLDEGEKVRLIGHWDGDEEARWIGEEIEAMQGGTRGMDPFDLDDMAILVRASHQMRAFEDRFLTIGLPYRVIGGPRFYERMEIRDAMAYFRVAVSPEDDLAFERIVNTPKRGIGDKARQKIQMAARDVGGSLVDGARHLLDQKGMGGKAGTQLHELLVGFARWSAMIRDGENHVEMAQIILDESGYTAFWQNEKTPEAPGRLENLKELVKALEGFENLQGFLEHVSLVMDNETEDGSAKASIMTLHAAKGLEFPVVFLPGWEDGLFPSQRSMDESGLKGLEEERRLAYVGITRAEQVCTISFAGNRRVFGQWQSALPSRFIDELPEAQVDVLTPPGLYGGGYGAAAPQESGMFDRAARADVYNSPGWKRMQTRAAERGVSQPRETRNMVIDLDAVSSFARGDRVFHKKFGYGGVAAIEGDKLEIDFDKAGTKKLVAKFVVPAAQADDVPF